MPNYDEELKWTPLPKLCQKCFGVKRKPVGTENIASKLSSDSVRQSLRKVKRVNTNSERRDEKDCPSIPVSYETSLKLTDSMLLSAQTSVSDDAICSSIKTTTAANVGASSSVSKTRQNFSCSLLNAKLHSTGSDNISRIPQSGFVRPLFKNYESKFDAQLKEADVRQPNVNNAKVTAAGNVNKGSDLHRCPLCDMVFDIR